jgi:hypothetical protein
VSVIAGSVPEPSTLTLAGIGVLALVEVVRRSERRRRITSHGSIKTAAS